MRLTAIGTALAVVAAPVTLASCVTTPSASLEHQQLCAEVGAPPGSPNYAECIEVIADAIRDAEREADREYGFIPRNIFWDCEIEATYTGYQALCLGEVQ